MTALVISATNLVEGGGLQVLRDCVEAAARLAPEVTTTAVVHDRALLDRSDITVIERPEPKRSWWRRIRSEYFGLRALSEELGADVWLSLHDATPNVLADRQYVYCHNPAPFYQPSLRQRWQEPSFAVFNLVYGWVYRINIRRNRAVIVQQHWLRELFQRRYDPQVVITAAPQMSVAPNPPAVGTRPARIFLYPAFPRVFKNVEVLIRALLLKRGDPLLDGVELRLTMNGTENRYARWLAELAVGLPQVRMIGRQDARAMSREYEQADVVVFPSTLETWGLPITEAKVLGKPILLSDLPYAHETLGRYDGACFLAPDQAEDWADALINASQGVYHFADIQENAITTPDFADWTSLLRHLTSDAAGSASHSNGKTPAHG